MTPPQSIQVPDLLHEFFDAVADRHPDQIAVEVPPGLGRPERVRVSYREMRLLVQTLASRIRSHVRSDCVIAILLPRDSHWLYVAQLAALKTGAAFTCLDASFPDEHIRAVVQDCAASVVLSDHAGLARLDRASIHFANALDVRAADDQHSPVDAHSFASLSTHSLAYIIYTSGTTGAPKGVMIEHRSIINLVASDLNEFQLSSIDRVGQGSSAAYDSSIEETWLAFAAGATLVVMDDQTSRLGPDLVPWLQRERISVFCPPPTLLRTTGCMNPSAALPDLRLLYVGGEALTEELANRWCEGRRMVNGYGPTECTVTVVRGDVIAGRPVTIGQPVSGHTAFVLDATLSPVPQGAEGELCIAGPGLARGYRNRPNTTAQKFPIHPTFGRIYRTGDLVRRNADGDFEYLGRIDAQIKLRGYRIELEAIESYLTQCSGVREAACRVQGSQGSEMLVAHIVPTDLNAPPQFDSLRSALRRTLPAYMVPSRFGIIDALPRTVGAKVDRKALPMLKAEQSETTVTSDMCGTSSNFKAPVGPVEMWIASAFASALRLGTPVSTNADFFNDLGGDSLSAVGVICDLRTREKTASITTRDLYESRTAARLAALILSRPARTGQLRPLTTDARQVTPSLILVTMLQSLWLLISLLVFSSIGYLAAFDLLPFMLERFGVVATILLTPALVVLGTLAYAITAVMTTVVVKWIMIGRYRPTVTRVWSWFYLRHWIVEQTARMIPWSLLEGTTAYSVVLRLLGARVGRRVHIHHGVHLQRGGWDLLTIGDDVSLGCDSWLGLVALDGGCLHIAPVSIGDRATLEVRAGVSGHTHVESEAMLTALSWLPTGQTIPAGERWNGVPAMPAGMSPGAPLLVTGRAHRGILLPGVHGAVLLASLILRSSISIMVTLIAVALFAWSMGVEYATAEEWFTFPTWSNELLLPMIVLPILWMPVILAIQAIEVRAMGRVKLGVLDRWSLAYVRVWHKTHGVNSASRWLSGTLFWPIWLRIAGMRVGPRSEISTIIDVVPECVNIGPECFFADGIYLGGPVVHRGTVTIGFTTISRGTFLGNHVVIPAGTTLPDSSFLGVCTVANVAYLNPGTSWFGHPAMELPRREVVVADRRLTHEPSFIRKVSRVFWESLRFALPTIPLLVALGWFVLMQRFSADASWMWMAFLIAPALTLAALIAECLFVLGLKWMLLGRVRAGQHPLWSCWCSRWDFLYVAWQFYAIGPLALLQGTLLLNMFLRATGAKIGRRVVLGPGFSQLVDPDMLNIADGATVNANFQAHSFEDRVLKLAPVLVRRNATIGENSVVFYGADIGEETWVAPNGVVMKNEMLPAKLEFAGCPVQPVE